MQINKTIASIPPSATLAITSKAKAMAAEGNTVFSFAAGEPDFDTPEHIKAAAAAALGAGATKYPPTPGLPALREAIAAKLEKENGLKYSPAQVVVSNGGKHSLFNIFMTICGEGDEIIIPSPYWLSYPEMVKIAGGTPVFAQGDEENDWKVTAADVEAVVTDKTRAIIMNSPSNPTGNVYHKEELQELAELAVRHDLYIVADEVYEKLIYDGTVHVSVGSLSPEIFERTITASGLSKAYSMTGWRLGYMAAPEKVAKGVIALQSHSTSGANTFAQHGAVEALTSSQECVEEMRKAFEGRRDCLYERLTSMPGVTCRKPLGAFYMFADISSFGMDSVTFAGKLLDEEGVALVPGAPFGADTHVRLSYACSMEDINGGMDVLEKFLGQLG